MRTKRITLYYELTPKEIIPPKPEAIARKDAWIKEIQRGIEADWKPVQIRVEYRIFNPEVEAQRKFFEGPVVEFYTIQTKEMLEGRPSKAQNDEVRETILSDALGYDVQLLGRTERRRTSTTDFTDTQRWHDFFEEIRETHFEPNGYEMPDSKAFWEMAEKIGYDKAKEESIKQLQARMRRKLDSR